MSFVVAAVAVVGAVAGATKIILAQQGKKERIAEQRAANKELARRKADLQGMDTSNPYENMDNAYTDLQVNTQEFEAQKSMADQQTANIRQSVSESGQFNAGNIQQLMNMNQQNAQQATASIGTQESINTRMEAQGEMDVQQKERYGELLSQEATNKKKKLLAAMSQQRKVAADDARQVARDQVSSGIGDIAGAGTTAITGVV